MITCNFEDGGKASLRHVVVHAIVEQSGKILLAKRAEKLLEGGKWSLPSGFLDRDETAADCAIRELREETGWSGEVVCLFKINTNPRRPHEDRQNIAIEFIVKALEKVGEGDWESTDIQWFSPEELPPLDELAFDHGDTVRSYLAYREKQFSLPIVV